MSAHPTPPMAHKIKKPHGEWVSSHHTDIRVTFKRVRERDAKEAMRQFFGVKAK